MKYSLLNNIGYTYKEVFKKYPKIKLYLVVNFVMELLVPLIATSVTTLVVYGLTSNQGIIFYIEIIAFVAVASFAVESLRFWSFLHYTFENTYVRNTTFWLRLTEHQMQTDYQNIEPQKKRNIITKAFESIGSNWYGLEYLMKQVPPAVINIVGMLVYGALIAIYTPLVLAIFLVMAICNFLSIKRANKYREKRRDEINDQFVQRYYLANDVTNPNYGKDIRLYGLKGWFNGILKNATNKRTKIEKQVQRQFLASSISDNTFLFLRDLIAYSVLIVLVVNGDINLVLFTFITGIVAGFSKWMNGFIQAFNTMRTSNIHVNEYRECLTIENEFNHDEGIDISKLKYPLSIEFQNVNFTYPEAEKPTIENLSFKIKSGEKIAIVGDNGAGKTTIIKLLCGLYKADSGKIMINGHDIMEFNLEEYMKLLGVVFQDSELLALTVENNVTCQKKEDVDKDKLWKVLEQAGISEKIKSLENKEDTFVTQIFDLSGVRFSGGEIQKLMLARALYKDAPLLILDEPTASLDPIAEENMYLKYDELVRERTSIFISHRLSSTKFCDRILFLSEGEIKESGSHKELMKLNGKYREVYDIQSKYYKEEKTDEEN